MILVFRLEFFLLFVVIDIFESSVVSLYDFLKFSFFSLLVILFDF